MTDNTIKPVTFQSRAAAAAFGSPILINSKLALGGPGGFLAVEAGTSRMRDYAGNLWLAVVTNGAEISLVLQ